MITARCPWWARLEHHTSKKMADHIKSCLITWGDNEESTCPSFKSHSRSPFFFLPFQSPKQATVKKYVRSNWSRCDYNSITESSYSKKTELRTGIMSWLPWVKNSPSSCLFSCDKNITSMLVDKFKIHRVCGWFFMVMRQFWKCFSS
jgi:hypothetical protein